MKIFRPCRVYIYDQTPEILVPIMFVKWQDPDELAHLVRNSEIDLWSLGSHHPLVTPIHYPSGHVWWWYWLCVCVCGGGGGGVVFYAHIFSS